jgi:hypothetical protein
LYTDDDFTGTPLGSPAWFAWLATATTFYYQAHYGASFTARCEHRQRGDRYWIAYRRYRGRLHRCYLGKADHLTPQLLDDVALTLNSPLSHKEVIAQHSIS